MNPDNNSEESSETSSAEPTSSITEKLSDVSVGDSIYFGNYEQDGDSENGDEEIEWNVLDEQDGNLLLISAKVLDETSYLSDSEKDTWADSYLRSWLNDEFLNTAFLKPSRTISVHNSLYIERR